MSIKDLFEKQKENSISLKAFTKSTIEQFSGDVESANYIEQKQIVEHVKNKKNVIVNATSATTTGIQLVNTNGSYLINNNLITNNLILLLISNKLFSFLFYYIMNKNQFLLKFILI